MMIKSSCENLEIDTKDICLLCLESRVYTDGFESPPNLPSSPQGLKHLLRYLKVSPKELFNCSTEFLQSMEIREDIDLKIILCSGCSLVIHKFNKLYQQYELIQLQFGNCVQSLYQSISEGNDSPERVRKYKDQMRPINSSDLVNASIAANFRNATFKKCFLKLQSVTPRVKLSAQNVNMGKYSKIPEAVVFESCSVSATTKRHPFQNVIESEFYVNDMSIDDKKDRTGPDVPLIETHFSPGPHTFQQMSTNKTFDIEDVAEVKCMKTNLTRKKSYFNYIRKLKSKQQPNASGADSNLTPNSNIVGRPSDIAYKTCEYCKVRFSRQSSLTTHISIAHSEHFISEFFPFPLSLQQCKQGVHAVWNEMFKISNNQCQFCRLKLLSREKIKRHLIVNHAEQFAMKVYEHVQSFPECFDLVEKPSRTKKYIFNCEYCTAKYTTKNSVYQHKGSKHPENIIYKFFPPHIPFESCRQGLNVLFKEMLKNKSTAGFKCKFCIKNIRSKSFIAHTVYKHGKQIALEAQKWIALLSEHLEGDGDSAADVANNSNHEYTTNNSTREDPCKFGQSSMFQKTDFEMEEITSIKLEIPPQEILGLDLDPLYMDYLE